MLILSIAISMLFLSLALAQLYFAAEFRRRIISDVPTPPSGQISGRALVVMSIRGIDPSLRQSVISLLNQDYADYEIRLVVDHCSDQAWQLVHRLRQQYDTQGKLTILEMRQPLDTCGLKCSALLQALADVDPQTAFLVLIDADVTPDRSWLANLLAPLAEPKVGCVTGNQWFEPIPGGSAGTWLRSLWNAGSLVATAMYRNPWAGSCAMRINDVRRAGLPDQWRHAIVDDGPIRGALRPLGLQIRFAPSLIMVNREQCTLGFVARYVTRMLTWSRVYETTFANTVGHALVTMISLAAVVAISLASIAAGYWMPFAIVAAAFVLGNAVNGLAYFIVRAVIGDQAGRRGETWSRVSMRDIWKPIVLMPLVQSLYGVSCLRSLLARRIEWRQIIYEVGGRSQVRMLRYQPMRLDSDRANSNLSI